MGSGKKIAFCFLVRDRIFNQDVWKSFFESLNLDFEIICHYKEKPKVKFDVNFVNTIETKWADVSLVEATCIMYREAFYVKGCDVAYLLSGDTLPIVDNFRKYVNENTKTTFQTNHELKNGKKNTLKKTNMFFCINCEDFKEIDSENLLSKFVFRSGVPDEEFWVNSAITLKLDYVLDDFYIICDSSVPHSLQAQIFCFDDTQYVPSVKNDVGLDRWVIGTTEIKNKIDIIKKYKIIRKVSFDVDDTDKFLGLV